MQKIKVLMVDDEAQFRETTSKILTRRGYETTMAGTGEEAMAILEKAHHDVVVLDIKMPGMGGHETLTRIKQAHPGIQVIMLTGHGDLESAQTSFHREAFDYLTKPCDIDRLAARINDAFTMARTGRRPEKKARDIMISLDDYTTIQPDRSVREGIEQLKNSFDSLISTDKLMQTGHRSILVLNDRGNLVGVLGINDLIAALRPAYLSAPKPSMADSMQYSTMFWTGLFTVQAKQLAGRKVAEIMSPPPQKVDADANLMELANLLYEHDCRRLVVEEERQVIGVVREQEIFFETAHIILDVEG